MTHPSNSWFAVLAARTFASGAALALSACTSASPVHAPATEGDPAPAAREVEERVQPAEDAPPAFVAPTGPPSYTLHEWGFLAASLDDRDVRSGTLPQGLSSIAPPRLGHGMGIGAGGKPVLYFHLDENSPDVELSVSIRPAGEGQLLEHFPPGELSPDGHTLRWPSVRITRGTCSGTYPPVGDPACQTSDGLCELAELSRYESTSADCVNVGDQRAGVLFYRSGPARAALPLVVTRRPAHAVRVSQPAGGDTRFSGWVMRIARGEERAQSRVRIVSLSGAAPVDVPPAEGEGTVGADAAITQLRTAIEAGGLNGSEADAFMAAWTDALFGAVPAPPPPEPPAGTIGLGYSGGSRHPLGSVADALIYVVPRASVDALLPLELNPAPRVTQRVFLARVTLSDEPVRLRLSTLTAEGGLAPEIARRVIRRHIQQLNACAEAQGIEPGRLTLRLRLLPNGTVERVTLEGMTLAAQPRACFTTFGQRLLFPGVEAPTTVTQVIQLSR